MPTPEDINMQKSVSSFILLCSLLTFYIVSLETAGGTVVYHIRPYLNSSCTQQNCLTLSQFAVQVAQVAINDSNITLVLLSGDHRLSTLLAISDIESFSITSNTEDGYSKGSKTVSILCSDTGRFEVSRVTFVSIAGIRFIGCGNNEASDVRNFRLKNVTFQGVAGSGTALILDRIANATIFWSHFLTNTYGSHRVDSKDLTMLRTGGAIILSRSTMEMIESTFEGNGVEIGGAIYAENNTMITISRCNATSNRALHSGSVLYLNTGCAVNIATCNISGNVGSVLGVTNSLLSVDNSILSYNKGGVISNSLGNLTFNNILHNLPSSYTIDEFYNSTF